MQKKLHFHFLGICGTAMGAVASAMARKGHVVTGSDSNVYPPMSTFLESEGIKISSGYSSDNLPDSADYFVIGNAISRGNKELEAVLESKKRYLSLPETMKEFFLTGKDNYVVSGTHGKTTTTSMLTWIMEYAGLDPSFMIGGIAANLGRGGRFTDSPVTVLEGDEYDTAYFDKRSKFLHYLPKLVIVNNIEFDHADIFDSIEDIKKTFWNLLNIIPQSGMALLNGDDEICQALPSYRSGREIHTSIEYVGFGEHCDTRIMDVEYMPEGSSFSLNGVRYFIPMEGEFNVRNAAMAVRAALFAGLDASIIAAALQNFKGVARRQEVKGIVRDITVIDDFAHHPTAIRQAISSFRQKYPGKRLWVLFEPRSNTTIRNVFQNELAASLALADISLISLVADKEKIKNVSERLDVPELVQSIQKQGGTAYVGESTESIVALVSRQAQPGDVIIVMSNGGFDGIHDKLLSSLQ